MNHLDPLTLNAWADELLAPAERLRVAAHLAECAGCRARAAGQMTVARQLRRLPPEPPPPALAAHIVAAVARQRRRAAWPSLGALSLSAALLGLALVVVALPDLARLLPVLANAAPPGASSAALFDLPTQILAALASTTFDWGGLLSDGAGVALLTGLVLLTGAAFGGLAELLQPEAVV